jgi:hypothetical protein
VTEPLFLVLKYFDPGNDLGAGGLGYQVAKYPATQPRHPKPMLCLR